MKSTKVLGFATAFFLILFGSCEKSEETTESTNTACSGGVNFCMMYGNTNKSGNAVLSEPPGSRYRVYWENTSGGQFEQVELDLYTSATGTLQIDTSASASTAFFQYFSSANGVNNGVSGTVNLTQFDPNGAGLSGTFTVTTLDGTMVTNGNFTNVSK